MWPASGAAHRFDVVVNVVYHFCGPYFSGGSCGRGRLFDKDGMGVAA